MANKNRDTKMRWTPDEYTRVAVHALPFMERKPNDPFSYFKQGMRQGLPRSRWRPDIELRHMLARNNHGITHAMERAKAMTYAERGRWLNLAEPEPAAPPPPKPAKAERKPHELRGAKVAKSDSYLEKVGGRSPYSGNVRWTDRELALLARRIHHMREQGNQQSLARLYIAAQEVEMPAERRRRHGGILQGAFSKGGGAKSHNEQHYERGLSLTWTIETTHPFDPERVAYAPAEPAKGLAPTLDDLKTALAQAEAAVQELPGTIAVPASTTTPNAEPVQAPTPVYATTPLPAPRGPVLGGLEALVGHVQQLPLLLAAALNDARLEARREVEAEMRQLVVGAVKASLAGFTETIVAQLHGTVTQHVHAALEVELGGPVAEPATPERAPEPRTVTEFVNDPPATDPDEHDDDMPADVRRALEANRRQMEQHAIDNRLTIPGPGVSQEEPTRPGLFMVDVIGLFPRQQQDVKRAFANRADVRLIEPDKPHLWTPRTDNVIIVNKGAGGLAYQRIRKEGIHPITISAGGTSAVIDHIEQMLREQHAIA